MALNANVIKAAREHIRRNDNPGEVENAKRLLDKHQIPYVEASGNKEKKYQPGGFTGFNEDVNVSAESLAEALRKMKEEMKDRRGTGSSTHQTGGRNQGKTKQQQENFDSWFHEPFFDDAFSDFLSGKKKTTAEPEQPKDYFFGCDTAADAIIAAMIFGHYNNGSMKTTDWDQKAKRFYMNNTTSLIANRTKDAFIRYKSGFKEAMIDHLEQLIKRNL